MTRILFYLEDFPHEPWKQALLAVDPAIDFRSFPDWGTPDDGPAYAVVWEPKAGLIKDYPNVQAVFSLGAGIDHILEDASIPENMPIIRMGDDGLKDGMVEFVVMNVLMHHRQMPILIEQQQQKNWRRVFSKPAASVHIGIMGFGMLGEACAKALLPFGYNVNAWSNSPKPPHSSIRHFTGQEQLQEFLGSTDILVGLLPETEETKGLLNKETIALLPEGASIINAGRGSLIDLEVLAGALEAGKLASATLDVVPEEPLAQDHPIWAAKNTLITPHIAAITRTETAANYIIENIKRLSSGEAPQNMLNRKRGY